MTDTVVIFIIKNPLQSDGIILSCEKWLWKCAPLSWLLAGFNKIENRGAWVAQSVKRPTSAQVMISRSMSSRPASGSVLTAQSLEPVSDSVSPPLSDPPPFMLCLSLSQK